MCTVMKKAQKFRSVKLKAGVSYLKRKIFSSRESSRSKGISTELPDQTNFQPKKVSEYRLIL